MGKGGGRSSNKPQRFPTGGDADAAPEAPVAHNPALDQAYIQSLLNRPDRMTWDEYKEKHKEQLSDRLGAGVEREQAEYRKMLDQERNRKLAKGKNNAHLREEGKKDKKEKKDKKSKKERKKEKKRRKKEKKEAKRRKKEGKDEEGEDGGVKKRKRSSSSSSSSSPSSSSSSSSEEEEKKGKKSKKSDGDGGGDTDGPVRLSDFHSGKYDD